MSSDVMDTKNFIWLEDHFTLVSTSTDSKRKLAKDIHEWMMSLSFKEEDKVVLKEAFGKFFKEKFILID